MSDNVLVNIACVQQSIDELIAACTRGAVVSGLSQACQTYEGKWPHLAGEEGTFP